MNVKFYVTAVNKFDDNVRQKHLYTSETSQIK